MARPLGLWPGGIQSLLTAPRSQWEAIEADLLAVGFTVADIPARVTWRALLAFASHSRRDSALYQEGRREQSGDYAQYSQLEHLVSVLIDSVRETSYGIAVLQWMYQCAHTEKGQPIPRQPKLPVPLERPGVVTQTQQRDEIQRTPVGVTGKHIGTDPIPMADFKRFWADPESYVREQNPEAN